MRLSTAEALWAVPLLLAACSLPPRPPTVTAEFDPAATVPLVPTPTDLAFDPATGRVSFDDAPDANEAQRQFNRYLRTLDGFPTSSAATATFSGPLNPTSVSSASVYVLDVTNESAVRALDATVSYEPANRRVRVSYSWEKSHTYTVALTGGSNGLKGENGEEVVASPAFKIARVSYPLATCSDLSSPDCRSGNPAIRGTSIEDERKKVVAMERCRRSLQPGLRFVEARGIPREGVALAWTFHTVRGPVVTLDPEAKVIPFPNDLLLVNGKVALPADPNDGAVVTLSKAALNQYDGFSTTAPLLTENSDTLGAADGRVNSGTLGPTQFLLLNLDAPAEQVGAQVTCRACGEPGVPPGTEPDEVRVVPDRPLRSHTRYAVLWLKGALGLEGNTPLQASPVFGVARISVPVFASGRSQLDALDDAGAEKAETLRVATQAALAAADARGISRDDVLLAWSFTTVTTAPGLAQLRAKPAEWALPTALIGGPTNLTTLDVSILAQLSAYVGQDFNSSLRWAKEGAFISGYALDPNGTELDLSNPTNPATVGTEGPFTPETLENPRRDPLRFTLFVPKTPRFNDGRIPVVVFQHGITRSRRDAAVVANSLAKQGFATVAIDQPLHGDRSYCRGPSDCTGGAACVTNRCPSGWVSGDPFGTPDASGQKYASLSNMAASRDQLLQLVLDQAQLMRVLADTTAGIGGINVDDSATVGVVERLEPANPGYIGMSLGSVAGGLVIGAIPEFASAVLNVGGASPADILLDATVPFLADRRKQLDAYLLANKNLKPGTQPYDDFFNGARWIMDPADAQNVGRHYIAEPLHDAVSGAEFPKKRVFITWVKDDPWVSNATTALLIRSVDATSSPASFKEKQYVAGGDHSFMMDVSPGTAALALSSQTEAVNWLAQ